MISTTLSTAWLGTLILLPCFAYLLAWVRPGTPYHTREVPADAFRLLVGPVFCALVDPSLGLLAAVSSWWWAWYGYNRMAGGTFWPAVAMALWVALHAPAWALDVAVAGLLTMGVVQTVGGVVQWFRIPFFLTAEGMIHGTFGHRTGFGIYLALLVPLAFLTAAWPVLVPIYVVGIALSMSSVAVATAALGVIVLFPASWWLVLVVAVGVALPRVVKVHWGADSCYIKFRHLGDSWEARRAIWAATWRRSLRFPTWLIGAGAGAFSVQARTWVRSEHLQHTHEVYNEAHNDWLESWYEYGLVGVLALAFWLYRFAGGLAMGDPVTAALAGFGMAMAANFPLRVANLAVVALLLTALVMRRLT